MKKLYVELTSACNLHCKMCFRNNWFSEPIGSASHELIDRLRAAFCDERIETVFFGGMGEPLLHPSLPGLLRDAKRAGKRAELVTNGTLLTGETAAAIAGAGVDRVWVSVDGFSARSYETVRRGGVYDSVTEHLRAFRRLAPDAQLGITFVLQKENVAQLAFINAYADAVGADLLHLSHVLPSAPLAPEDALYDGDYPVGVMRRFTPGRRVPDYDRCPFIADEACFVRFDGAVCPCMQLLHNSDTYLYTERRRVYAHSFGNLLAQPLGTIWDSPAYDAFRARVRNFDFPCCTVCLGCEDRLENRTDCMGNEAPTCGACLWAQGVIRCP